MEDSRFFPRRAIHSLKETYLPAAEQEGATSPSTSSYPRRVDISKNFDPSYETYRSHTIIILTPMTSVT